MLQKNNNFLKLIIALLGLFSLFFIVFNLPMAVQAEEPSYNLPYVCEFWDNNFTFYTENSLDVAVSYYYSDLYTNASEVLVFTTDGFLGSGAIQYLIIGDPYIDYDVAQDLDYTTTAIAVKSPYPIFRVGVYADGRFSGTSSQGVYAYSLLGNSTLVTTANGNYLPRYPFYYDGEGIYDTNGDLIITQDFPISPIQVGVATLPQPFQNPIFQNGQTAPTQVPTLTVNNYSWTTAPTPDLSTLENTQKSIYNFLQWLGSNLSGALDNIVDNIGNVGDYIAETIQYYGGMIVKEIQNGIQTFYNNMVSLFEPIVTTIQETQEKITEIVDFFTDPWDEQEFETRLSQSDFYTAITTIQTNTTRFYNHMSSIEEPDHFTLHYSTGFHPDIEVGGSVVPTIEGEISFDWLYPLRNIYRPILWVICVYQMFEYGCSSLSGALLGHNSRR